jgi:hypothetical protein
MAARDARPADDGAGNTADNCADWAGNDRAGARADRGACCGPFTNLSVRHGG